MMSSIVTFYLFGILAVGIATTAMLLWSAAVIFSPNQRFLKKYSREKHDKARIALQENSVSENALAVAVALVVIIVPSILWPLFLAITIINYFEKKRKESHD